MLGSSYMRHDGDIPAEPITRPCMIYRGELHSEMAAFKPTVPFVTYKMTYYTSSPCTTPMPRPQCLLLDLVPQYSWVYNVPVPCGRILYTKT